MPAKKAKTKRRITKPPSKKQLAARKKFIAMVRAKSKAAKSKKRVSRKAPAVTRSRARNGSSYVVTATPKRKSSASEKAIELTVNASTTTGAIKAGHQAIKDQGGLVTYYRFTVAKKNPARRRNKTIIKKARKVIVLNPRKKAAKKGRKNPSYTVEAQPKYSSTVKKTVSAFTRGSAIRKVKKTVPGPKNVYKYSVTKNPRKKRGNPSVKQIRKTFAGTVGKTQSVFAPIGTPKNVAKLGTLKLIDTETAKITPRGTVYLCADAKGKLHIVGSKNAPIYTGPAQSFGKIALIEYDAAKPHLYPGQGTIRFWHKLGEESGNRPTLIGDGKGGLRIRGGSYKVTREGLRD